MIIKILLHIFSINTTEVAIFISQIHKISDCGVPGEVKEKERREGEYEHAFAGESGPGLRLCSLGA